MNQKIAFKNTLEIKNVGNLVFVPFVYGLAAKIGQISLREMVSNATYYAHSLEAAYRLFNYDVIINNFDSTIEPEVFGCNLEWHGDYEAPRVISWESHELKTADLRRSSRIPILMETTKRIVMSLGKEVAVVGILAGPCSLVKNLLEPAEPDAERKIEDVMSVVGSILTKLTRSLCELKVDGVFFREDSLGVGYWEELLALSQPYTEIYTTLFNVIRYFNSYPLLIVKDLRLEVVEDLHKMLKPSGVILGGERANEADLVYLKDLSNSLRIAFGLPLPMEPQIGLWDQFDIINDFICKYRPAGFFYTSDGEIPHDMPLEIIHDLVAKIHGN